MLRRTLRLLGLALALVSVVWIVWRFADTGAWLRVVHSPHAQALFTYTAIGIPIYAAGLCCLATAWWCLQTTMTDERLPFRRVFAIYAISQFGKYLPGNVGQYVGRHILLRKLGTRHSVLVWCSLTEAGFLLMAAIVWATPQLAVVLPRWTLHVSPWQVLLAEILALFSGCLLLQWARRSYRWWEYQVPFRRPIFLAWVLPLHMAFFTTMIGIMLMLAMAWGPVQIHAELSSATAASWIAGYLVLGAPGGLGVREAIFLLVLRGHMPEDTVLALAAALRVASFGGDLLFFLLGIALEKIVKPAVD